MRRHPRTTGVLSAGKIPFVELFFSQEAVKITLGDVPKMSEYGDERCQDEAARPCHVRARLQQAPGALNLRAGDRKDPGKVLNHNLLL